MGRVIRGRFPRRTIITLPEAMESAIRSLGAPAKVSAVIEWIRKHVSYRDWADSTIRAYFYQMARPQRFTRTKRGYYETVGQRRAQAGK